jgi:hypothetical protein
MPDDPQAKEIEAGHRRLGGPPFDADVLTPVVHGLDRLGTWEMRDGLHPVPQDEEAVRTELILHRAGRGGSSILSGIGPRLGDSEIGRVGTAASAGTDHEIGYVKARCRPSVASVRVHFDDGSIRDIATSLSPATGLRWAVCPLDSASIATRIEFLDGRSTVLDNQTFRDPRTYETE